jgi:hypothetical protein
VSIRSELLKKKKQGYKVYEFGTRLIMERPHKGAESPLVTKHLTDKEYDSIKDLIDGIASQPDSKRPKNTGLNW